MSKGLPTKQRALKLLSQSGCPYQVIRHSKAVMELATQIAKTCKKRGANVDIPLVQIGALLHDIGRSRVQNIDHVIEGVKIAESLGLPRSVVSIIGCHAGGGITTDEAKRLGWPIRQYLPQTLEEKIVAYADKLIEGSHRVKIQRTIVKLSAELGSTHPSIKRIKKLHDQISSLVVDGDAP